MTEDLETLRAMKERLSILGSITFEEIAALERLEQLAAKVTPTIRIH